MLRLAARVPDHRMLTPWRFIVIEGEGRRAFGDALAKAHAAAGREGDPEEARKLPMRAPVIVTVVSSPVEDPKQTPVWEQELSAGAVCQNLLIAACAMGWAASWISEWPAFDADVAAALGLGGKERVAGFFYLGTPTEAPLERKRPDMDVKTTYWTGS